MDIRVDSHDNDNAEVIWVSGRVDSATSPELHDALQKHAGEKHHIVLDLSGVDYMSSAGVRAIVAALRTTNKHHRKLLIAHPSSRVSEVLELAGLRSIFEIYDSPNAALGVIRSS